MSTATLKRELALLRSSLRTATRRPTRRVGGKAMWSPSTGGVAGLGDLATAVSVEASA
jgi:hypothetical protein